MAGEEHYRNFRTYEANGGIQFLADKAGLSVLKEIKNHTNHIAVLSKNNVYSDEENNQIYYFKTHHHSCRFRSIDLFYKELL